MPERPVPGRYGLHFCPLWVGWLLFPGSCVCDYNYCWQLCIWLRCFGPLITIMALVYSISILPIFEPNKLWIEIAILSLLKTYLSSLLFLQQESPVFWTWFHLSPVFLLFSTSLLLFSCFYRNSEIEKKTRNRRSVKFSFPFNRIY